jgi:cytochrome c-type biogenesis protein CcsB
VTRPELFLVWPALVLFAAAFVAELFGLVFRRPPVRRPTFGASVAGFALLTAGVLSRWIALGHGPVMRTYENSIAASWFLFAVFLGVSWRAPRLRALLVGVLPAIVLMIGNGVMSSPEREPLLPPYQSGWLWIHVGFAWLSYASFVVAAVLAALYLVKRRRAEREGAAGGAADAGAARDELLPAAPELDDLALRTILFGFVCHTVMVGAGAIWAHGLWGRYWAWDPIETWSLISWIVYGLYLHLRLTYGWRGRRAAWLAIAAAAAVVVTFGGMGFTAGVHTRLL